MTPSIAAAWDHLLERGDAVRMGLDAQQDGQRIYVRWKLTSEYKDEKQRLIEELHPQWA